MNIQPEAKTDFSHISAPPLEAVPGDSSTEIDTGWYVPIMSRYAETNWRPEAACKDENLEWFFAPASQQAEQEAARRLCRACPVATACLSETLMVESPRYRQGIYAGLSGGDRTSLIRKLRNSPERTDGAYLTIVTDAISHHLQRKRVMPKKTAVVDEAKAGNTKLPLESLFPAADGLPVASQEGSLDPLDLYLLQLRRHPLLTGSQLNGYIRISRRGELASRVLEQAKAGGERISSDEATGLMQAVHEGDNAFRRVWEANLRWVVGISARFRYRLGAHHPVDFLNLIQGGNMGLYDAVKGYDPDRGIAFSTYAYWPILKGIFAAGRQHLFAGMPDEAFRNIRQVYRAQERLYQELQRTPTKREIAQAAGVSVEQAAIILAGPCFGRTAFNADGDAMDPVAPGVDGYANESELNARLLEESLPLALNHFSEAEQRLLQAYLANGSSSLEGAEQVATLETLLGRLKLLLIHPSFAYSIPVVTNYSDEVTVDHIWSEAACREVGPSIFLPGPNQPAGLAQQVCKSCAVRGLCRTWALGLNVRRGVWGGMQATALGFKIRDY